VSGRRDIHNVLSSDDHVIALGPATATHGDRMLVFRTAEITDHVRDRQVAERWAFSDDREAITDFFIWRATATRHRRTD
jgi:hypothetical protein